MREAHEVRKALLRLARATERPSEELLQYYGMERFLYRLSLSPFRDRFVLKGGLLMHAWNLGAFRATRDIDLLARTPNSPEHVGDIFRQICVQLMEEHDGVSFAPDSVTTREMQVQNRYRGVQVKLKGQIDRSVLHLTVDTGFSDTVYPKPVLFFFPTLLEARAPKLLAYTRESVVAEKVDAMLQLGHVNTRMKDFFDLWHLATHTSFDLFQLAEALRTTTMQRGTLIQEKPSIMSSQFQHSPEKRHAWFQYRDRNRLDAPQFPKAMELLRVFLSPVLMVCKGSDVPASEWNPNTREWLEC